MYAENSPTRTADPNGLTSWSFSREVPGGGIAVKWFWFLYTAEIDCHLHCNSAYGDAFSEWAFADCMDACDMVFPGGGGTYKGGRYTITIKCTKKKICNKWKFECSSDTMP